MFFFSPILFCCERLLCVGRRRRRRQRLPRHNCAPERVCLRLTDIARRRWTRTRVVVDGGKRSRSPSKSFTRIPKWKKNNKTKNTNESLKKTLLFPPRTDCRQRVLNTGRTSITYAHSHTLAHETVTKLDTVQSGETAIAVMMIDERRRKSSKRTFVYMYKKIKKNMCIYIYIYLCAREGVVEFFFSCVYRYKYILKEN